MHQILLHMRETISDSIKNPDMEDHYHSQTPGAGRTKNKVKSHQFPIHTQQNRLQHSGFWVHHFFHQFMINIQSCYTPSVAYPGNLYSASILKSNTLLATNSHYTLWIPPEITPIPEICQWAQPKWPFIPHTMSSRWLCSSLHAFSNQN